MHHSCSLFSLLVQGIFGYFEYKVPPFHIWSSSISICEPWSYDKFQKGYAELFKSTKMHHSCSLLSSSLQEYFILFPDFVLLQDKPRQQLLFLDSKFLSLFDPNAQVAWHLSPFRVFTVADLTQLLQ